MHMYLYGCRTCTLVSIDIPQMRLGAPRPGSLLLHPDYLLNAGSEGLPQVWAAPVHAAVLLYGCSVDAAVSSNWGFLFGYPYNRTLLFGVHDEIPDFGKLP